MSFEEPNPDWIHRELQKQIDEENNRTREEFDGRSSHEMFYMINDPFHEKSPLQFKADSDRSMIAGIPIVRLMDTYLRLVEQHEPVKLTTTGNLPLKLVNELYGHKILTEEWIESGLQKIRKETDTQTVHRARVVSDVARWTKKRHNKLSLTKSGRDLIRSADIQDLFKALFTTYTLKLNWAYFDAIGNNTVGQVGFAFMLEQLSRYGETERPASYYADKFLNAFPMTLDSLNPHYRDPEDEFLFCFEVRTLERFLHLFGFIEIREEGEKYLNRELYIRKTPVLDEVFSFR